MTTDSTNPIFDPVIERVAQACDVPTWWVEISYRHSPPDDEAEGLMRWTVRVNVIRLRARQYEQTQLQGFGETIDQAATEAIESVKAGYAQGTYGPTSAGKRKR